MYNNKLFRRYSLVAFNVWLLILFVLAYYGFSTGNIPWQIVPMLLILASLSWTAWEYTGRKTLTVIVLLSAALGAVLGYASESSGWMLVYPFFNIFNSNYLMLVLAVLFSYLALIWFRTHPEQYSKAAQTELKPKELEELAATHQRRRRRFRRFAGAIISVILAANIASLFTDSPADISSLYPPAHTVTRDQNSYYLLESASLSPDVLNTNYEHTTVDSAATKLLVGNVTGAVWDQAEATKLFTENTESIKKFQAAGDLTAYQIPGLEHLDTQQPAQNFNIPQLQNYTVLSQLNLLAATNSHNPQQQADLALTSLKVARQVAASNQTYIGSIVATKLETTVVQYLASRTFPAVVQAQIIAAMPGEHEIWQNARSSIRTVATLHLSGLPGLYSQVRNPAIAELYPPFNYQPNRTASLIASNYQKIISLPDGDCGNTQTPDYSAFPSPLSLMSFNGVGKMFARYSDVSFNYKYQCALEKEIQHLSSGLKAK